VPIVLERGRTADGAELWRFARATVARVPELHQTLVADPLEQRLPPLLVEVHPLGVPLWKWIAAVALVPLGALAAWGVTAALRLVLGALSRRRGAREGTRTADRGARRITGALRLAIAVALIRAGLGLLRLPLAAQDAFDRAAALLLVAAFAWAAFRLLDTAAARVATRLRERGAGHAAPLVLPARKTAKVVVVVVAGVVLLDNLGIDVTAVLAGLGVGGLAVALAAQRPLENLFSGITLYADQPVRVGDFCRFGSRVGTIEEIGLRSTRIRTLDRTLVTVPNREFASAEVENFGARDKIWYHPMLGLRYETTPDQMRDVLLAVHRMLSSHPSVEAETARVRFIGFGAYSLDLEVFAYVRTSHFDEFLVVAEDLNLRLMDIVEEAGTGFAFPSTTTYLERGASLGSDRPHGAP
jgi:MscS family membrane protein